MAEVGKTYRNIRTGAHGVAQALERDREAKVDLVQLKLAPEHLETHIDMRWHPDDDLEELTGDLPEGRMA